MAICSSLPMGAVSAVAAGIRSGGSAGMAAGAWQGTHLAVRAAQDGAGASRRQQLMPQAALPARACSALPTPSIGSRRSRARMDPERRRRIARGS